MNAPAQRTRQLAFVATILMLTMIFLPRGLVPTLRLRLGKERT